MHGEWSSTNKHNQLRSDFVGREIYGNRQLDKLKLGRLSKTRSKNLLRKSKVLQKITEVDSVSSGSEIDEKIEFELANECCEDLSIQIEDKGPERSDSVDQKDGKSDLCSEGSSFNSKVSW